MNYDVFDHYINAWTLDACAFLIYTYKRIQSAYYYVRIGDKLGVILLSMMAQDYAFPAPTILNDVGKGINSWKLWKNI